MATSEPREIFVRAHTVAQEKERSERASPPKWPAEVLVFDCETTTDTLQSLNFGAYRRCKLGPSGYKCVEEGLFYADDLSDACKTVLEPYVADPRNVPGTEVKKFPPQIRLNLYPRNKFVEYVFWKCIRRGAMVVGFNLPFDLSRLAVRAGTGEGRVWSLTLSMRPNKETGEPECFPERPHIKIESLDSKMALISLSSVAYPSEWPHGGRFLDLHTFGRALRDESFNLKGACKKYGVEGKMVYTPTGRITAEEIDYCRQDVKATAHLLNAMKKEFDQHPLIDLLPDRAYSPASIAKAYMLAMGIELPKEKFHVSDRDLGIAMQSYYGGRAECRIRKVPVPVVHTDFTSQYPSVNALLGNFIALTAETIAFIDCTDEVRELAAQVTLNRTFDPAFWKELSFFALVVPEDDIFPVRTVYNGRTQNIGLNHLTSKEPIWFAGPDLIASCLLAGPDKAKAPRILKAIRMVPRGRQPGLKVSKLGNMVAIDPESDDFFCHVIEQKTVHKPKNKDLSHFLKILANSGSYGLFVQVNQDQTTKPEHVKVFSGEISREGDYRTLEKAGPWYFPPLAALITAGGRLLLTMLERCVKDAGGSYLFCDTDSLCIVSSKRGGLVACPGGDHRLPDGREAVKALSWSEVNKIAERFDTLNPYNCDHVPKLLKIEDINFVDSDPSKPPRQLFGFANSAKRYVLYEETKSDISIVKASGHGLGYLCPPDDKFNKDVDAPQWIVEAWDWVLRNELGLPNKEPSWLDYPAMMRMALTSPNVMPTRRPDWLWPFNFFFLPLLSGLDGYPAGCNRSNFRFITPFSSDRKSWPNLRGINALDGREYEIEMVPNGKQDTVVPESLRIILRQYLRRPESKSLAPDGGPCVAETIGLLRRASVVASEIVPVGKETDRRWEQGEDMSLLDFEVLEYREGKKMAVASPDLRDQIAQQGLRATMRATGLSQHTIERAVRGERLQPRTLKTLIVAARTSRGN